MGSPDATGAIALGDFERGLRTCSVITPSTPWNARRCASASCAHGCPRRLDSTRRASATCPYPRQAHSKGSPSESAPSTGDQCGERMTAQRTGPRGTGTRPRDARTGGLGRGLRRHLGRKPGPPTLLAVVMRRDRAGALEADPGSLLAWRRPGLALAARRRSAVVAGILLSQPPRHRGETEGIAVPATGSIQSDAAVGRRANERGNGIAADSGAERR